MILEVSDDPGFGEADVHDGEEIPFLSDVPRVPAGGTPQGLGRLTPPNFQELPLRKTT